MKTRKTKKIIASVLSVFLIFGSVPMASLAGVDLPELPSISSLLSVKASAADSVVSSDGKYLYSGSTITGLTEEGKAAISGEYTIPTKIDGQVITEIGKDVFNGCTAITELTIPESITSIGSSAFKGCKNIKKITFNSNKFSVYPVYNNTIYQTFANCTGVTEVEFGTNVTKVPAYVCADLTSLKTIIFKGDIDTIGAYAFYDCTALTSFDIPENVREISDGVFGNCTALKSIDLTNIGTIEEDGFANCISFTELTIPESITSIGSSAFKGCKNIKKITVNSNKFSVYPVYNNTIYQTFANCTGVTEVEFGTNVTKVPACLCADLTSLKTIKFNGNIESIGEYAFEGCKALTSFDIPENVREIAEGTFKNCTALKSIDLTNIREIKSNGFANCISFTELTIPENITSIGSAAFKDCKNIKKITVNSDNFSIDSTYDNTIYQTFANCTGVTEVEFGTNVTKVPAYLCANLTSLNTIKFNGDIKSIGAYAFNGCTALTSFDIPENVREISDGVFGNCTALKSIDLTNIRTIKEKGFVNCVSLTDLIIPENITSIGSSAFKGCKNIKKITFNSNKFSVYPVYNNTIYQTFANCTGVTEVEFGTNVTKVPAYVCADLTSLRKVTFNGIIASIGNYAFSNCPYVEDIYCPNMTEVQWKLITIGNGNEPLSSEDVTYHYKSASVDDNNDKIKYTIEYFVNEILYKTQEYEAGKTIIPPTVPVKQGFNFKGWDNLPSRMPESNIVVYARFEAAVATLKIRNSSMYNGKTVDYKSSITFYAVYENCNNIEWYVNGQIVSANADGSCTLKQVKDNVEIYCTAKDSNGNTIKSESETINVKHSIIDKLIAFFLGLFGLLPIFNQ